MSAKDCQPFQELLSDLAEGELEAPEASRVEGHVAVCASCRADLALIRGVVKNLVAIGEEEVPLELASRVMAQVRQPSLVDRILETVFAPFSPGLFRIALPVAAMITAGVFLKLALPTAEREVSVPSDQFASVPVWWGGNVLVNEVPHPATQSGTLGLRPGDSLRTGDKVEVEFTLKEAHVEVRPKSSLIMKRDGLYLAEGEIVVRVDEERSRMGEEAAMKVATPNAIVIHVGTVFKVNVSKGTTRTDVSQGKVLVYATSGASTQIGAGQAATIDESGLTSGSSVEPPQALRPARTSPEEIRSISQSLPGGPTK